MRVAEVALRPVNDADLDALFEQMRDPESVRMAAFTAKDPDDRAAFDVHMAKIRASPEVTNRIITLDGRLVGSVASFAHGAAEGGFAITGTETAFANGRNAEIELTVLRLDGPARRPGGEIAS